MRNVKVFTDRYPLLGPSIWMLSIQYFAIQIIVASAWSHTAYSWRLNTISDLGNTVCGLSAGRNVCSPLHGLMNLSFITLGTLMAFGALFIYQEFRENLGTLIGFSLMAIAGIGTVLVGVFPENTVPTLHSVGASMPFGLGNLGLVILGATFYKVGPRAKAYTFLSGLISLIGLALFASHHYLGLGIGGMERIVAYPQTVWLILFGIYMTRNHILRNNKAAKSR